jgi:2-deoxy-D-gluconate 3-dehydrogenase
MNLELEGKVAIVTGASRGLGRAIVFALAAEGARVIAVSRGGYELEELASEAIHPVACDLRERSEVLALPAAAFALFGQLDILVNNAGIAPAGPFIDQEDQQWAEVFMVNATAPAMLTRGVGRYLISNPAGGKIINIASTAGIRGKAELVAYSASKGAIIQFTRALAAEWARYGIQVNAVAPGAFETAAQSAVLESPDLLRRRVRKIPSRRLGAPDEVCPLVCLLASPISTFINGAVFTIDGGEVAKL